MVLLALSALLSVAPAACRTPLVGQSARLTPTPNFCAPPSTDPTAAQAITDVATTTMMADWPTGKLAPQNRLNSFARNQSFLTAVKVATTQYGLVRVESVACSDGHDARDWEFVVTSKTAGWVTDRRRWVYDTLNPADVGRIMQIIYWNNQVARVNFVMIRAAPQPPQPCPAVPEKTVPGFHVTGFDLTGRTVNQEGDSRVTVYFDSTVSGSLDFFLCEDGTTMDEGEATVRPGANQYYYDYRLMVKNPNLSCPTCELYGPARWYVTFDHIVIIEPSFTITQ